MSNTIAFRGAGRVWATAWLVMTLSGCNTDSLLKVTSPGTLDAGKLDNPQQAALIVNGAVADFECALGAYIMVTGTVADEFADAQLAAAGWAYDRRDADTDPGGSYGTASCAANQVPGLYTPVSVARFTADDAVRRLEAWTDQEVPKRQELIATASLYAGFTMAMLGMSMCSAAIDVGPEMSTTELFAAAEARFTKAITVGVPAGATNIVTAAYLGRARVRLFMGKKAEAAADAKQIPAGFKLVATASAVNTRRQNRIFASNVQSPFYTIEPQSRTLTTGGVEDPRTKVTQPGTRAQDGQLVWIQTKYAAFDTPIPVARYEEAQLILAEAEGSATAVTAINALRTKAGLPQLSDAEKADMQKTIIEERRRELFVEGFRFYDMKRFSVPFDPAPGTAFPTKGGSYGATRCFPIPNVERFNNPNLK